MTDKAGYPQAALGGDRFGKRRVPKMYAEVNRLRDAIRAHDADATEAAWEAVEQHIDFAYQQNAAPPPAQAWQTDMSVMPKGVAVLAALSNGWHEIITDRSEEGDYAGWYIAHGNVSLPIERTHPTDTNWECMIRAVAWMPLPAPPAALIPDTEGQ